MDQSYKNALARLERVGGEHSRATEKLHQAAVTIAGLIEEQVPCDVDLPRGYRVVRIKSYIDVAKFLVKSGVDGCQPEDWKEYWIDGSGGYLHGDLSCFIPAQTRAGSLQFATDIAEGLLNEITEFLEKRAMEAETAAKELKRNASQEGGRLTPGLPYLQKLPDQIADPGSEDA
jgi:hypothetical protein